MSINFALYMNNPTAGATDGTRISNDPSDSASLPLTAYLDASKNEEQVIKCAIRCDSSYFVNGDASIFAEGTKSDKWKFAIDDDFSTPSIAAQMADWNDIITLSNVTDVNKIFWSKASSSSLESPSNDSSTIIYANALVSKE